MAHAPAAALPKIAATSADLEGMYRFFRNPEVRPEALVAVHAQATAERCRQIQSTGTAPVIVVHDTTDFEFEHLEAEDFGFLNTGAAGFRGHFALAVNDTEVRQPLGVLSLQTIFRKQKRRRKKGATGTETSRWGNRESERWGKGIKEVRERIGSDAAIVHVMDREADSFELLDELVRQNDRFVVRLRHDRRAKLSPDDARWSTLRALVSRSTACLKREVPLSPRRKSTAPREARRRPARKSRMATLHYATTQLTIPRPRYLTRSSTDLSLNVIRVYEVDAPPDEPAVEWLLFTNETVESADDVARVVDTYRCRWVIEEYFKALKTGCAYESRYAGSAHALLNILAVSLPIAAHLIWLRSRSRTNPDAPATDVLTDRQIEVIRRTFRLPWFPEQPTARDVLLAIAENGGHMRSNGEPGWLVLQRGFKTLLEYERGWAAAAEGLNL